MEEAKADITWGDAVFMAVFGSLVFWGSIAICFITVDLIDTVKGAIQ